MFNFFKKKNTEPKEIYIEELITNITLGSMLVIDSRNPNLYNENHIDKAINIPDLEFENNIDKLPLDKLYPVVFYCKNPECSISINSAKKAIDLGYKNVYLFRGGIEAWNAYHNIKQQINESENALDVETFKNFYKLNKNAIMLIDLNSDEEYSEGHLKGAISLPFGKLGTSYEKLPKDKNIIFYCHTSTKAYEAYLFLRDKKGFEKGKILYLKAGVTFENGKVIFNENIQ
ncbi:rhodanese-like domain-containing protein [Deferribacterales bacterium Es71-Z0220]|jgi:rhodanese-related sulfurtransferase|uniref:rhodanese-like domain-containing protein n=1 Tax=Deferrivibrio essentukiensis TaxID=2880922 RepID=UPI001F609D29|nr:rhodanese-like domain-containing protein [Deferrivibrio essentukiensis]MBZ4672262.1 Rhodanese domain protein [Deferribacteraceae bacterium]MCB4203606.1 rhodanese-like domain-containing protein [Deferrivibrio essentukiensis]